MKYCQNCGAQIEDDRIYCPNCGAQTNMPVNPYAVNTPKPEPVSIGGFIGRSLIPLIPFVGGIVYIIMLFIWGGDTTKEESFRNWAKAQLIMMAIGIVLSIILVIALIVFAAGFFDAFKDAASADIIY